MIQFLWLLVFLMSCLDWKCYHAFLPIHTLTTASYKHKYPTSTELSAGKDDKNYQFKSNSFNKKSTTTNYNNNNNNNNPTNGKKEDKWKGLIDKLAIQEKHKQKQPKTNILSQTTNSSSSSLDELQCIHYEQCSGCITNHHFLETPIIKRAKSFMKALDIPFHVHLEDIHHWRTHVKLAVQETSKWGGIQIGLYKAGTHEVIPIPHCQVHHPNINEAIQDIKYAALETGITAYRHAINHKPSSGELKYVQLSLERTTGKIQLTIVWNASNYLQCYATITRFIKYLKKNLHLYHSITVNFHDKVTNSIFDYDKQQWKLFWGPIYMKEKIGNAMFYFKPQIFRQANLNMFEHKILPYVIQYVPSQSIVSELYAGIGLIGMNLLPIAKEIYCSDSNPFIESVFDKMVDNLPEKEHQEKIYFETMNAQTAIQEGQCDTCDVLIVDPPRKGLDAEVIQFLTGNHPTKPLPLSLRRVIYVSCGFEALEHDMKTLLSSGKWKIRASEGFALFPGSDHIETVVVFDR